MAMAFPDGYAAGRLHMSLYPWQIRVLDAMSLEGARVAVRTCNESGKTSTLMVALILWHMETQKDSLTVTTSGSYRQLKEQLHPHLVRCSKLLDPGWEFGDGWGRFAGLNSRLVSFSASDPGKAEGWHAPVGSKLLIIMDEAKTLPQSIYDAFERAHATRWICLSSPGSAHGPFYDLFHKYSKRWQGFRVPASDCPHLWSDPVKRADLEHQIHNLRPELVQSMIYADFVSAGQGHLFDMVCVDAAMHGDVAHVGRGQYAHAGFDNSGGGDEQVLAVSDGNRAWFEWTGFLKDELDQAVVLKDHLALCGIVPSACYSDDGGIGQAVNNHIDHLYAAGVSDGVEVVSVRRFDFNGRPRDPKMFANMRAEGYFNLSKLIRQGRVILPDDDTLREELAFIKYDADSSPLQLVDKKKFPRSPNRADALMMLFYDFDFAALTAAPEDRSDITSPTRTRRERFEFAAGPYDRGEDA